MFFFNAIKSFLIIEKIKKIPKVPSSAQQASEWTQFRKNEEIVRQIDDGTVFLYYLSSRHIDVDSFDGLCRKKKESINLSKHRRIDYSHNAVGSQHLRPGKRRIKPAPEADYQDVLGRAIY